MIKVKVNFYGAIKDVLAEPQVEVQMPKDFTMRDLLGALRERCGEEFGDRVLDGRGGVRVHVRLFVNKQAIDNYDLDSRLNVEGEDAESTVFVLPSSEGG